MLPVLTFALGLLLGAAVLWLVLRPRQELRLASADTERQLLRERVVDLEAALGEDQQTAQALAPLSSTLARVERQVEALERDRSRQYGALGPSCAPSPRRPARSTNRPRCSAVR